MKVLNFKDVLTSSNDDFLYTRLMDLLYQIKLTQGGTGLDYTLKRHPRILNYCKAKQLSRLSHIEDTYFFENGALDTDMLATWHAQHSNLNVAK